MNAIDSLLAIGSILTFVCFDCANIQTSFVQNKKLLDKFKKLTMTTEGCCINCGSSRCYIKNPYGREVKDLK